MDLVIAQTLVICSLITSIAAVIGIAVQTYKRAKSPNERQNERLDKLEEEVAKIKENLRADLDRFEELEEANKILMQALLALLAHGIDGNEVQGMKDARDELQNYLIGRRTRA